MFKLLTNLLARMIGIEDDPADVAKCWVFPYRDYSVSITQHYSHLPWCGYRALATNTLPDYGLGSLPRKLETAEWESHEQAAEAIMLTIDEAHARGKIEH